MNRPVHFEIHAGDPERAEQFYGALFGWKFQKMDLGPRPYWMVVTGDDDAPGINGGMMPRQGEIDGEAVIAWVCTVEVENVDTMVAQAQDLGGQQVVPKMAVEGMGWVAYCKDTEGNIFGMWEQDEAAKG